MQILAALLCIASVNATPLLIRNNGNGSPAATYAGATSSDIYPPPGASPNTALFPSEPVVGYPGPTPTGAAPFAIATAPTFPGIQDDFYPLVKAIPAQSSPDSSFDSRKYWGNLTPRYTVPSSAYGLDKASPLLPDQCGITQVHILYRHGARYPTSGSIPTEFSAKLQTAATSDGFSAKGDLSFLNKWTYKLGAELLTPFGRKQEFELGIGNRMLYGDLLQNFTDAGVLPVFRTESEDRMVKSALNFASGFFGVPEYLDEVNILLMIEDAGFNNTGAPYDVCTNANDKTKGSIGNGLATEFSKTAFKDTIKRLQPMINGVELNATDIIGMLQLCSYETVALGYSKFCELFTEDEFRDYEYYYDLIFYYNNGFGSPVAAAQGLGFLQEFVARFQMKPLTEFNSTTNATLDSNPQTFPLNQSIYADATHEVVVLDFVAALNLTSVFQSGPLPLDKRTKSSFVASQTVPFATNLVMQVLECSDMTPTKQIRMLLNDAVLPLTYPGCDPKQKDGMCAFDTVLAALERRVQEIDFDYSCFGNYTVEGGKDLNGLPPKRA